MTVPDGSPARAFMRSMRDDVLNGPCSLDGELRRAIFEHAGSRARGDATQTYAMPDEVRAFVDAVVKDARTADVEVLRRAGHGEERIYEIAVIAAVGAGSERGVRGLMLLQTALGGLV